MNNPLHVAFARVRLPEIQEIRELFQVAQPKVLEMVRSLK